MHCLIPLFGILSSLLHSAAHTTPLPLIDLNTKPINISTTASPLQVGSLSFIPPTGPAGQFECLVYAVSQMPIQPKDIFKTVIHFLEDAAQGDFNSRMPEATTRLYGPSNLIIRIDSADPAEAIPRRFVMWALSKILITMEHEPRVGYHASVYEPQWRGEIEGRITVGFGRPTPPSDQQFGTFIQGRNATAMVGADEIAWFFKPATIGDVMTMREIAMGTIGALITAANTRPSPAQRFELFTGDFIPESRTFCHYEASTHPSQLSKSILVRTLAASSLWAIEDGDFHNLEVDVLLDGRYIAKGGYDMAPFGLPRVDDSTTLSSF